MWDRSCDILIENYARTVELVCKVEKKIDAHEKNQ